MKKLLVYVLLSTALSVVFFSCKKYEDGPLISFIPAKKRAAGDWKFDKVTVTNNGNTEDHTSLYADSKLNVQEEGSGSYNTSLGNTAFTWTFDDKREHFIITISGQAYNCEILRLANKEFWLKTQDFPEPGTNEIHLKQ